MKRTVNIKTNALFERPSDHTAFTRASPGDIIEIIGKNMAFTVVVRKLQHKNKCEECCFNDCPCLCVSAHCSDFEYTNISNVMENL